MLNDTKTSISSARTNSSGQRFYQVSGRDPYMRKSAIILAALLTARPTLAAEQCLEVKPNLNIDPAMQPTYAKYADTAHCFLRIDGKVHHQSYLPHRGLR